MKIFRKIKYYKKVINQNKDIDNDKSITIKSLEEISELKDSNYEIKNTNVSKFFKEKFGIELPNNPLFKTPLIHINLNSYDIQIYLFV